MAVPAALDALTGHAFGGQTKGISHSGAYQGTDKSLLQLFLAWGVAHFN
jgi:hypothetical protein